MKRSGGRGRGPRDRSPFPGFGGMLERRRQLITDLVARRRQLGLSQSDVAARMGTSQPAVARLESGAADIRLTTLERYAVAVERQLEWRLRTDEKR